MDSSHIDALREPEQEAKVTRIPREVGSLPEENLKKLESVFPDVIRDGQLQMDVFKQLIGAKAVEEVEGDERYGLSWPGKAQARQQALKPSSGTLIPEPEKSRDWDTTENVFIEADNLEAMRLLLRSYAGKVSLTYLDPPYNTGNDFVYNDDFSSSIEAYKELQKDWEEGKAVTSNAESSGSWHTEWLSMMLPRFKLAHELLDEHGMIIVSIDDRENHNLRHLMDEVFGQENFITQICWKGKSGGADSKHIITAHEYVVVYAKRIDKALTGRKYQERSYPCTAATGRRYRTQLLRKWGSSSKREDRPSLHYPIHTLQKEAVFPMLDENTKGRWRWGRPRMQQALATLGTDEPLIEFTKDQEGRITAYERIYETDQEAVKFSTWFDKQGTTSQGTKELRELLGKEQPFDYPKPQALLRDLIKFGASQPDAIILDLFGGSGSLEQAIQEANASDLGERTYIVIQLPEPVYASVHTRERHRDFHTVADITRERIRRSGDKVRQDNPNWKGDIGFRSFKLDESTIFSWTPKADIDKDGLMELLSSQPMKIGPREGVTNLDLLFEAMLKLGEPLTRRIQRDEMGPLPIDIVEDGRIIACMLGEGQKINREFAMALAEHMASVAQGYGMIDTRFLLTDASFEDDSARLSYVHSIRQLAEQSGMNWEVTTL